MGKRKEGDESDGDHDPWRCSANILRCIFCILPWQGPGEGCDRRSGAVPDQCRSGAVSFGMLINPHHPVRQEAASRDRLEKANTSVKGRA